MTDDDLRSQKLLDALDLPAQAAEVLEHPQYRTVSFCLRYLERCEDLCGRDPRSAVPAARVATMLAQKIPKQACAGIGGWCSLQTHSLAVAANALRSASDFDGAEATCRVARFLFADHADDLARADLLQRLASLRQDQCRFGDAERHLTSVIGICQRLGRNHLGGCALVDRGLLSMHSGRLWQATGDFFQALSLVDRERSPRYHYSAAHHLAIAMAEDREANPSEALHWLRYAQRINQDAESSLSQLKLLWAEGRILEKKDMLTQAEHYLQTVRTRLLEHSSLDEYALASLDLAGIYLKQSRTRQVRTLAGELFPIFHRLRGDRDALNGLKRFHRAAVSEALSLEVLRPVKAILRSRTRPVPGVEACRRRGGQKSPWLLNSNST